MPQAIPAVLAGAAKIGTVAAGAGKALAAGAKALPALGKLGGAFKAVTGIGKMAGGAQSFLGPVANASGAMDALGGVAKGVQVGGDMMNTVMQGGSKMASLGNFMNKGMDFANKGANLLGKLQGQPGPAPNVQQPNVGVNPIPTQQSQQAPPPNPYASLQLSNNPYDEFFQRYRKMTSRG